MKKWILCLLFLVSLAPALRGQDPAGATVRAHVVDWTTGLPLVDAAVTLFRQNQTGVVRRSDSNGQATFESLQAGRHSLRVSVKGYRLKDAAESISGSDYRVLEVGPNSDVDVRVEMVPSGTISGTVRDAADKPLAGLRVVALQKEFNILGHSMLTSANAAARTNERGEYALGGLPDGEYFLKVEGQPPVYYPGTTDSRNIAPVILGPPSMSAIGIDIPVRLEDLVKVSGEVVNVERPESGVAVDALYLVPVNSQNGVDVRTLDSSAVSRAGHFEIDRVASGEYDIIATYVSNGRRYFGRSPLDVHGRDVDGTKVTLYPPADIGGRAVVRTAGVQATVDLTRMFVGLTPIRSGIPGLGNGFSRIDGAGNLRMESVLSDEYWLTVVGAPQGYYVESVKLDNLEVLGRPFSILSSSSTLDVTLGGQAVTLQGTVQSSDGRSPVDPLIVVLIPLLADNTPNFGIQQGMAQRGGDFAFLNVPPGRYRLIAFENIPKGFPFYDPHFLEQYLSRGTLVNVEGTGPVVADTVAVSIKQ